MKNDAYGDRMKSYEAVTCAVLPPHTFTIIRVDGRAFHTYLRHAEKPFDQSVMDAMAETAVELCEQVSGTGFAYVQSDEISLLLCDMDTRSQAWFGGEVQKMVSVSASIATMAFNRCHPGFSDIRARSATFDSRVYTIPMRSEVMNYFKWRQQDAIRNAVSMAGQAHFPHKSLHGMTTAQVQERLFQEEGINFKTDYSDSARRGAFVHKTIEMVDVTQEHQRDHNRPPREIRRKWTVEPAPEFNLNDGGPLANVMPYDGQGPKPEDFTLMFGHALGRAMIDTALKPAGALWAAEQIRQEFADDDLFRAWMMGMNPALDDKSPLLEMIAGNVEGALAAHRAYKRGDFA